MCWHISVHGEAWREVLDQAQGPGAKRQYSPQWAIYAYLIGANWPIVSLETFAKNDKLVT